MSKCNHGSRCVVRRIVSEQQEPAEYLVTCGEHGVIVWAVDWPSGVREWQRHRQDHEGHEAIVRIRLQPWSRARSGGQDDRAA